jgi:CheY-like chemotaxis protein
MGENSKKKRILIIEDNPLNLKLVRTLLEIAGVEVLEAIDGESGVAIALVEQPDLILMDIQLPGIDGLEATAQIKKNSMSSHIPIIAVTSFAMSGDKQKTMDAGCDGYISKPIDTRTFTNDVMFFLEK